MLLWCALVFSAGALVLSAIALSYLADYSKVLTALAQLKLAEIGLRETTYLSAGLLVKKLLEWDAADARKRMPARVQMPVQFGDSPAWIDKHNGELVLRGRDGHRLSDQELRREIPFVEAVFPKKDMGEVERAFRAKMGIGE